MKGIDLTKGVRMEPPTKNRTGQSFPDFMSLAIREFGLKSFRLVDCLVYIVLYFFFHEMNLLIIEASL